MVIKSKDRPIMLTAEAVQGILHLLKYVDTNNDRDIVHDLDMYMNLLDMKLQYEGIMYMDGKEHLR